VDFDYSPRCLELQTQLLVFMDQYVYPNERRHHEEVEANRHAGNPWVAALVVEELKALARKHTRAPLSEIGHYFGRRSHSTVISAHRRVEKLITDHAQIGLANQSCNVEDAIRKLETALRTA